MAAKGKRTVESVEFRKAKGGVISETRFKTARGGQGGGPDCDYNHETAIHTTAEHAQAHLGKMFFDTESGTDKAGDYDKEDRGGPEQARKAD